MNQFFKIRINLLKKQVQFKQKKISNTIKVYFSFYKKTFYESTHIFIQLAQDSKLLEMNDHLYKFDSIHLLGFDQFYQSIQTKIQSFAIIKAKDMTQSSFIAVSWDNDLKFSIVDRIDDKFCEQKVILTNPFGSSVFQKISNNLQKDFSKQNISFCGFSDDIFLQPVKNSPDLLVKDIYGPNSSSIGLPQKLLASSLGKLSKNQSRDFGSQEIKRSLLIALAINAGQVAGLLSKKTNISDIVIVKNKIGGITFNRFFYTILKFNNSESQLYMKVSIENKAKQLNEI